MPQPFGEQPKHLSLKEFMTDTKIPSIKAIRDDLFSRFRTLSSKYNDFTKKIYKDGDTYYIHIKVPSETINKFFYDVVIMLVKPGDDVPIKDYYVRVHSNSPSFTFRYAYVLNRRRLTIPILHSKMHRTTLTQAPEQTNPYQIPFYEKTIFFALMELERLKLLDGNSLEKDHFFPFNQESFLKNILSNDEMTILRKSVEPRVADTEKDTEKKEHIKTNTANIKPPTKAIKAVEKTKTAQMASTAKKTKRI